MVFHKIKNDSHLIMHELGIFDLEMVFIPNRLEKYASFSLSIKFLLIAFNS